MYDEKDHDGEGMSFAAKAAWCAVLFMILFVVLPAASYVPEATEETPIKRFYEQGLWCVESGESLLCDRPVLTNPPPTQSERLNP